MFFHEQNDSRNEQAYEECGASYKDHDKAEKRTKVEMGQVIPAEKHDAAQHDNERSSKNVKGLFKIVRKMPHFEGQH